MPPGDKFNSIYWNISHILAMIFTTPIKHDEGLIMFYVARFRRDHIKRTGDIHDFEDTISSNEMEIEQIL